MSVLIADAGSDSATVDAPAPPALHERDTATGDGALVMGDHSSECAHHTADGDCPSCTGILGSGPEAMVAHTTEAISEHPVLLEQAPPGRELPPPKHA